MVWTHPKSGRHQMVLTSGGWVSPGKGNRGRRGVRRTGKEQRRFTQKNGDWETEDVTYIQTHTYIETHIYTCMHAIASYGVSHLTWNPP